MENTSQQHRERQLSLASGLWAALKEAGCDKEASWRPENLDDLQAVLDWCTKVERTPGLDIEVWELVVTCKGALTNKEGAEAKFNAIARKIHGLPTLEEYLGN